MLERLGVGAGSALRHLSALSGAVVQREEYPCGRVTWGVRDGALLVFMVLAGVGGFTLASAMGGGGRPKPVVVADASDETVRPGLMLKIQVVKTEPKPSAPGSSAPIPTAAEPPRVWSQSFPKVAALVPTAPVRVARFDPPAPMPDRVPGAVQLARAAPPAPVLPVRVAPVQVAARAPSGPVSVPMALRAQSAPPPSEEDDDLAAADRELAAAYREAQQAGVPQRDLRSDRQAWNTIRANAAGRSRRALFDAYQDHIDDLRDLADDAQASRGRQRYSDNRDDYPPAYGSPYQSYGAPYPRY